MSDVLDLATGADPDRSMDPDLDLNPQPGAQPSQPSSRGVSGGE